MGKPITSWTEEKIFCHNNEYLLSENMLPTRKHQAYEELLQFQREFAGVIYFQRILERCNY